MPPPKIPRGAPTTNPAGSDGRLAHPHSPRRRPDPREPRGASDPVRELPDRELLGGRAGGGTRRPREGEGDGGEGRPRPRTLGMPDGGRLRLAPVRLRGA